MKQSKVLIDSSAYLALAESCHPLLFREFGDKNYCLYITDDLRGELDQDCRLQPTLEWIWQVDYRRNRSRTIQLSREERARTDLAVEYIRAILARTKTAIPAVDAAALASAKVLDIPLVSANSELRTLATSLGVTVWTPENIKELGA